MDWPYHFPHPADVIAEEAERTRHLTIRERLVRMLDLTASAVRLARTSGRWADHRRVKDQAEAAWQRAHREVFERYGR
jgi:hypothetical protein